MATMTIVTAISIKKAYWFIFYILTENSPDAMSGLFSKMLRSVNFRSAKAFGAFRYFKSDFITFFEFIILHVLKFV